MRMRPAFRADGLKIMTRLYVERVLEAAPADEYAADVRNALRHFRRGRFSPWDAVTAIYCLRRDRTDFMPPALRKISAQAEAELAALLRREER